eukprot:Opistho-2@55029
MASSAVEGLRLRTLRTVADVLLPETQRTRERRANISTLSTEQLSSCTLQQLMYFNMYFWPFWLAASIVSLESKYDAIHSNYKYAPIVIYIIMSIVEPIRIYLGYCGNLLEKVPQLAGFWILTLIIQLPLCLCLLLNNQFFVLPLEYAINIPYSIMLGFQVIVGYFSLLVMTRMQSAVYQIRQYAVPDKEVDPVEEADVSFFD